MFKLKFRNPIVHVEVTERDWKQARARSAAGANHYECCPNALACNRALRRKFRRHTELRAEVVGSIDVYDGESFVGRVRRPKVASDVYDDVIVAFDVREDREPVIGSYDLDLSKGLS
jgi:hypothetical protein